MWTRNYRYQIGLTVAIVSLISIFLSKISLANSRLTIVQTEQTAPDGNGQFNIFSGATINAYNEVVFNSRLINTNAGDDDDSGIYRMAVPRSIGPIVVSLEQIVRENQFLSVSGRSFHLNDLYITSAFHITNTPLVNQLAAGDFTSVAMMLPLVPSSNELGNSIIAVESETAFNLVAEAGDTVPSLNGVYTEFNAFSMVGISSNNNVTYFSSLDNTENGAIDNSAYFRRYNDNSIVEIVRKGDPANMGTFTRAAGLTINDYGVGVFVGYSSAGDDNNNSGLYKLNGSNSSLVVNKGDSAPINEIGDHFFSDLQDNRINNQQQIGFKAFLRDENGFSNGSGLFLADGLSIKPILLEGQTTPDGTATYGDLLSRFSAKPRAAFNDLGQFALIVDILTESSQIQGVFRASETEVVEIARKHLSYADGTLRNFKDPALNNNGLVVFQADLALEEVQGPEGPYLRTEDILIISDGVHYETIERQGREHNGRTISEIFFNNHPVGPANGFSDTGTVTYQVRYEDGHQGILAWIPDFGWRNDVDDGEWDDVSHWHFGGLPDQFTDLILDPERDIDILGPIADLTINTLSLGGNTGNIHLSLQDSTLNVSNGLTIHPGSSITGQGELVSAVHNEGRIEVRESQSFTINGETTNEGEIHLGDEPNMLTIQGKVIFTNNSSLSIKIAGLQRGVSYSSVEVGSSATLAGTLHISFPDNFSLSNGDSFQILVADQILGKFDNIVLPDVSEQGLQLSVTQSSSTLALLASQVSDVDNAIVQADSRPNGGAVSGLIVLLLFALMRKKHIL